MQVPILNGIYADGGAPDLRTSYPRNLIPVPKQQGVSNGYLRQADGIVQFGPAAGPGADRGGINWNGTMYRVMGTKLVSVDALGIITVLGDVGVGGAVTLDYSFDRLGVASAGNLFYWDGAAFTQNTAAALGTVLDVLFISGYWLTTDGKNIVVTDLNNPYSVNPLKYGSSEADPDAIKAVNKLRNELYAFNRHTIEIFINVGGNFFPFQVNNNAIIEKGIIGTHTYTKIGRETFAFMGSGRDEAPAVYMIYNAAALKISTREIDQLLLGYTELQLSQAVMESKVDKNHKLIYLHLPDQTLVYDVNGSQIVEEPVWFKLTSSIVGNGTYRARYFVWAYDQWLCGDTASAMLGAMTDKVSSHFGQTNGWDFSTTMLYLGGNAGIIHELELVSLSGQVAQGAKPIIWTSYTTDGITFSQERPVTAGNIGQRDKRICWRSQGRIRNWRVQKFRGTSDAHLSFVRLEAQVEKLRTRPDALG